MVLMPNLESWEWGLKIFYAYRGNFALNSHLRKTHHSVLFLLPAQLKKHCGSHLMCCLAVLCTYTVHVLLWLFCCQLWRQLCCV